MIAALIGGRSAEEALTTARRDFRALPAESLEEADLMRMADGGTSRDLQPLTSKMRLGRCDAFLSHSWHDSAELKWLALLR